MGDTITTQKLHQYFAITQEALTLALEAKKLNKQAADEAIDMVKRYVSDAKHFHQQGNAVLAFAALNYAHGWLDCAARNKFFLVNDSRLFTVDED